MAKTNWTVDQKKAIDKRDANILVSASAGSGKTAVLVERIIEKVLNEFLDVDKLLVVTFTNAAAQELKEKILNAIYKALETETDHKRKNHLKNQLIYINRACITTIDAFCFKLVRENFSILDLDPNIKICEESQSMLIKAKVLEDLLEAEYEKYEDRSAFGLYNILELFGGKDEAFLEELLKIYNYIQAFPYPFEWLKEQIEKYNIDETTDLYNTDFGRDIYNDTLEDLDLCFVKYNDYFEKLQGIDEFTKTVEVLNEDQRAIKMAMTISEPSWDTLYDNLNNIKFGTIKFGKAAPEDMKEEIKDFRNKEVKAVIEKLKKKVYAKSEEILKDNSIAYSYMSYLYDFLFAFDTAFRLEKKQQSIAEFNDITHYTLELLVTKDGSLTDIAEAFKTKFSEVYTDEYQDTSLVQETILNAVSKESNRFMVGDIKQSIYGFRQARPDIFNEKYTSYDLDNDENTSTSCKIILSQNFRSRNQVIDSINYIFEKIMSMKNGQCEYGIDESLKCGNTSFVNEKNTDFTTHIDIVDLKEKEFNTFDDTEGSNYEVDEDLDKFEIEAKCIVYRIKEILEKDKVMQKDGTLRAATYKDIVILLRGIKGKAQILEDELKRNNIPVFSDVATSIFDGDETKLILSFLRVIDNPYQDVYMVSLMYSIIGGFSLDEITKLRLYDSSSYIYDTLERICADRSVLNEEDSVGLYIKIYSFLDLIKTYINYSKIYTISELLVKLYKDTNIYYQFALEENAESIKANLDYLIELASNFYSPVGNTLNAYIKYVDNLKDKQDASTASAKIIGENENVVRIMTIHKSKGLEFPIVILADIGKKYNFRELRQQKVLFHQNYGIGINIVNQDLGVTYPSLIKHAIKNVIEKETKSEEIRLLYVALTRAKEKLYLIGTCKDYDKAYDMQSLNIKNGKFNESLVASSDSYFGLLLPVIKYYNNYESDKDKLEIRVIRVKEDTTEDDLKALFTTQNEIIARKSAQETITNYLDESKIDMDIQRKIKDNFENEYEYLEETKTPARISVSELKKAHIEEDNIDVSVKNVIGEEIVEEDENSNLAISTSKYPMPTCLNEEEKYTAVRKGLLIHFILQNLDFKVVTTKAELKDYLEKMVYEHVISSQDRKYISVNKIYNFLESQIGIELKNAKEVYKEYEFVLENKKISKSLIQGVIDLFYVTQDNRVILVDFKTDKLTEEKDFIDRYKIQLDIYKEAINNLTDKKVDKTYIYSFNMNKMIEIE